MRITTFWLVILISIPCFTYASTIHPPVCHGTNQDPCIVLDTKSEGDLPAHFRSLSDIDNPSSTVPLRASGSSALPTELSFRALKSKLTPLAGDHALLIDIDLRQEPHGYLNQQGVTLMSENDWYSRGKSPHAADMIERRWLATLKNQYQTVPVLHTDDFKAKELSHFQMIPVKTIESEASVAKKAGFLYYRFDVTDHLAPSNETVDAFVRLLQSLPPNAWLHVHCRGGDGRTTTFLSMIDMWHHADQLTFDEIIARQKELPPFYDLAKVNRKNKAMTPLYQERYAFLKAFYAYAKARREGFKESWQRFRHQKVCHRC